MHTYSKLIHFINQTNCHDLYDKLLEGVTFIVEANLPAHFLLKYTSQTHWQFNLVVEKWFDCETIVSKIQFRIKQTNEL